MNGGAAGAGKAEAAARLLAAWRGEVEARAVYDALAARERDPKRAAILRRMADGERGHRARLEARLRDLGVAVPEAGSVRLSPWTQLQVRFAPIDRVLAWREAMENNETVDTYARPTGDAETDALFAQIRKDERSHALAVEDMRDGDDAGAAAASPVSRSKHGVEFALRPKL